MGDILIVPPIFHRTLPYLSEHVLFFGWSNISGDESCNFENNANRKELTEMIIH